MKLDYSRLHDGDVKWGEFARDLSLEDLRNETNRLYNKVREILETCTDNDISFEPYDPEAHDPHAENEADKHIGWTIGHIVAHITASNEEGAAYSSILARGISMSGRIRYEVPWQEINTVEKAIHRLEESRRIVLAYLNTWPDEPHLDVIREFTSERAKAHFGPLNAKGALMLGIGHHAGHIDQIREALRQSREAIKQQAATV